jgi:hypothetical protein
VGTAGDLASEGVWLSGDVTAVVLERGQKQIDGAFHGI